MYVIDGNTGDIIFSDDLGTPLISTSSKTVIPSLDGYIYFCTPDGLQKYPHNILTIAGRSPYSYGDGIHFESEKDTKGYVADFVEKKFKYIGSENRNFDLNNYNNFISRSKHTIKAFGGIPDNWTLNFSVYITSFDDKYNFNNSFILKANMNGDLTMIDKNTDNIIWKIKLNSPPAYHNPGLYILRKYNAKVELIFEELEKLNEKNKVIISYLNETPIALELPPYGDECVKYEMASPLNNVLVFKEKNVSELDQFKCPLGIYNYTYHSHYRHICRGTEYNIMDSSKIYWIIIAIFICSIIFAIPIASSSALYLYILFPRFTHQQQRLNQSHPPIGPPPSVPKNSILQQRNSSNQIPFTFSNSNLSNSPGSIVTINSVKQIGSIILYKNERLGEGGTSIVYKGIFHDREVAIKKIPKICNPKLGSEIKILIEADDHPNIIKYYGKEEDRNNVYLAMSLEDKTLCKLVQSEEFKNYTMEKKKNLLTDLINGLNFLHDKSIVHRDIKPQNVLLGHEGVVKISDMGLAKNLNNTLSFTHNAGTCGWKAPELLEQSNYKERTIEVMKKIDIFSLGCLLYYILNGGNHPFGDNESREYNIINRKYELSGIDYESKYLISRMIEHDPKDRYTIGEVKDFPLFWKSSDKVQFLKEASDLLEKEKEKDPYSSLVLTFEYLALKENVRNSYSWRDLIDEKLIIFLEKYRRYDYKKLSDLLRALRNIANHYRNLDPDLQKAFSPLPDGILNYFLLKFPKLFLFTYLFMKEKCKNKLPEEFFLKDSKERKSLYYFSLDLEDRLDCPPGFEHVQL